jgi:threonine/homoserine/homoserine lactone efflux protein
MPAELARQVCSPSCDAVAVVGELHAAMESSVRQAAAKGVGISGLNPKVFLLFLALLLQFTDSTADWPLAAQVVSLGLAHVASCALVYTGVGTGARLVLRAHPSDPSGDPLLRCCDGPGRCAAPGRATGLVEA